MKTATKFANKNEKFLFVCFVFAWKGLFINFVYPKFAYPYILKIEFTPDSRQDLCGKTRKYFSIRIRKFAYLSKLPMFLFEKKEKATISVSGKFPLSRKGGCPTCTLNAPKCEGCPKSASEACKNRRPLIKHILIEFSGVVESLVHILLEKIWNHKFS